MNILKQTMAEQVAQTVRDFQQQRTGHAPQSVTVVFSEGNSEGNSEGTLVITLHGALTPAEKALSRTSEGAAQVREFHRELFQNSIDPLRKEIERITGVAVSRATAEIEPSTGAVVQVFTTGTMVQVFQMASGLSEVIWNGNKDEPSGQSSSG